MASKVSHTLKSLNGVMCVYKPREATLEHVLSHLNRNIREGLRSFSIPPKPYVDCSSDGKEPIVRPSYADNALCSGPWFRDFPIELHPINPIGELSTGVLVACINNEELARVLGKLNFTKCYHIKGILGQATVNFHIHQRVLARAKFEKVTKFKFEKVLANYQSTNQRKNFDLYGISLKSQEAYDFAVRGLFRPTWKGAPLIYSLKLVEFEPPDFTIEVQCIHTTEAFLLNLIHNLGLNLKCYATCTGIRCLRHGCFHVGHSLVRGQWNLDEILGNIQSSWDLLQKNYPKKIKFAPTVHTRATSETSGAVKNTNFEMKQYYQRLNSADTELKEKYMQSKENFKT